MSKVITDKELGQIIYDATHKEEIIDDVDSYNHFLEDLAKLITDHFGGEVVTMSGDDLDGLGFCVHFGVNEFVPSDGGIFKDYDTDVTWKDGEETQA